MNIQTTISKIRQELIGAVAQLDSWFDKPEETLTAPTANGWTVAEVLEHVMLTNHFLLLLIEKGSTKCLKRAKDTNLQEVIKDYCFDYSGLDAISDPEAFTWENPAHMTPTGCKPLPEIRSELRDQLYRCLCLLDDLRNGEGVLVKTQMTVHNLGKLDIYQYLYFLVMHIRRHLRSLALRQENLLA